MAPRWAHACDYHRVQDNVRQYTDNQGSQGSKPSLWTSVVALSTMAIYVGWFHILLGMFVAAFFNRWAAVAFAGMVATAFLPMRAWPGMLATWVFSEWRRYFRFSYIFEENVSPYNNYIMAQFPHGACPIGTILAGSAIQTFWPEFNAHALVASFIFNVPGWRQMHAWMCAHPATRGWLMKLLTGGGHNQSCWAHLNQQQEQDELGQAPSSATVQGKQQQEQQAVPKPQKKRGSNKTKPVPSHRLTAAAADGHHSDSDHDSIASTSSSGSSIAGDHHRVTAVIAPRAAAAAEAPLLRNPPHPLSGHLRDQPVVSNQPLHTTLGRKIGVSVGILVGGIAELFLADPDVEHIVVKKRKGFVRGAVETGSYLLPTYFFGQSVMLKFGPRWLRRVSRKLRTTFGCLYGPFGLPVPYQVPILMVCGKPIPVTRMSPDTPGFDAYVDQVHAQFVAEVERIYHTYKGEYGWANRPLVVH